MRKQALLMQTTMTKNLHLLKKKFSKTWRSTRQLKCSNQINPTTCLISLKPMIRKRMILGKVELEHIMLSFKRKSRLMVQTHILIKVLELKAGNMDLELEVIPPTIQMKTL